MISMGKSSQSKYPAQFSGHLTAELDQNLASLDGNTYKVWSCLNRLLDSRAVNVIGQYLGYTVRVTQTNIAQRVSLSIATVKRCLKRLEDASIISVERPTWGCNRYRLTSYQQTIEAQAAGKVESPPVSAPAIPSLETIAQYERAESITRELSRAQSCDPPIAQSCEPRNRPVLSDKGVVDFSPPPPSPEEKTIDRVASCVEREKDLADVFYSKVLGRPVTDSKTRRRVNRDFNRRLSDIAQDERVKSMSVAREVLIDAFHRVKRKVTPIWSPQVMTTGYGEEAIEEAIQAHPSAKPSETVATLTDTLRDSTEPCDELPDTQTTACPSPLSVDDRIRYLLAGTKSRDPDHAVRILQRKDSTLAREDIIRVIEAFDKERSDHPRSLISCLSPFAIVEGGRGAASECADFSWALRGKRQAEATGG